ncbi:MAG: acyl-CoA thioesterase [Deltaproteobacteria bacterium]|nr:acyl-CoA thioesterase [Deltaproteobacteria bacterium]
MPRPHRHTIEVVPADDDIDELDHVSNLVYLRWVLEVARAHSDGRGWDHAAYRRLGAIWVVRRHEVDYLQPARRDERVRVTTWVEPWKRVSCVRCTEIVGDDGRMLARASTTWAFVDLATRRPTAIPDALQQAFVEPA